MGSGERYSKEKWSIVMLMLTRGLIISKDITILGRSTNWVAITRGRVLFGSKQETRIQQAG